MASPEATRVNVSNDDIDEDEEISQKMAKTKREQKRKRLRVKVVMGWAVFLCILGCLVASFTSKKLGGTMILNYEFWRWSVLLMATVGGMLITDLAMRVTIFLIEKSFLLRKKLLYFVHGLKRHVEVVIWVVLIIVVWLVLFSNAVKQSETQAKVLHYVTRNLFSLLIGSIFWLLKSLWLGILAADFDVKTFFDRIQESIFHQYILQTLSGPPLVEMLAEEDALRLRSTGRKRRTGKNLVGRKDIFTIKEQKVSAWTMKALVDIMKKSPLSVLSCSLDEDEPNDLEITSEWEARAAAYRIFRNVAKPGSKYIDEEDLLRFLIMEEVDLLIPWFEGAVATGRIDKKSLRDLVVKVYQERKALVHSLNDTHIVVRQLNKFVTWILVAIIINIWLLLMDLSSSQVLISQLLGAAFVFGNTCKNMFEGIIFVLAVHPFDVGDRCVVDGVVMLVEEVNIFTTVFLKLDNEKVYYPNSALVTKPISNYYRSPEMGDSVEFTIDISTPLEKIGMLEEKIKAYLESHPKHWHPNCSVLVKQIEDQNKLKMAVCCVHTINFQDLGERNRRRTQLVIELKKIFEELGMKFCLLPEHVNLTSIISESKNVTEG